MKYKSGDALEGANYMADEKENRIEKLIKIISSLTDGQLYWLIVLNRVK